MTFKADPPKRREEDLYVETGYKILFEDEFFIAADKPSPLPVHPVGRFKEKNLLSLLKRDLGAGGAGLRIVNRLDSETSGIVLAAKDSETAGKLGKLFEARRVEKEYRAIVLGVPAEKQGVISISLGTCSKRIHNIRTADPAGQTAVTEYSVLKEWGSAALLKIIPKTGRTHQIRAHLSFKGHPIAGDKIYIDADIFERYIHEGWQEEMKETVKSARLLLHASGLKFQHPETGEAVELASRLPNCFETFMENAGLQCRG